MKPYLSLRYLFRDGHDTTFSHVFIQGRFHPLRRDDIIPRRWRSTERLNSMPQFPQYPQEHQGRLPSHVDCSLQLIITAILQSMESH